MLKLLLNRPELVTINEKDKLEREPDDDEITPSNVRAGASICVEITKAGRSPLLQRNLKAN